MFRLMTFSCVAIAAFPAPAQTARTYVKATAVIQRTSENTADLIVTARIEDGLHIYAQTQPRPVFGNQIHGISKSCNRVRQYV